jgi:hypothetical protein
VAVKQSKQPNVVFIVNPAGAIHDVSESHAQWRLHFPGWRRATKAEVEALTQAGGNQSADKPLVKAWNPDEPLTQPAE